MRFSDVPFRPTRWLPGGHLQTLFSPLFRAKPSLERQRERLTLDDGDFIDVDWCGPKGDTTRCAVLLHGLTGSSNSLYILGQQRALAAQGWQVTALDISAKRLKLLEENLKRTGLEAEVIAVDAFKWEPEAKFDAILIDAPCTATGTARRHPDVLHRIGPRQIERASGWLTPGGALVYAVCSLESQEGEDQAEKVWLPREPISAEELPAGLSPTAHGTLRTDPGMLPEHGGLDGFFIARWRNS